MGLFFDRLTLPKLLEQCAQGLYLGFNNLFICFGSKLFGSAVLSFAASVAGRYEPFQSVFQGTSYDMNSLEAT